MDKLLNESIECLCNMINCAPSLAKTLLLEHRWSVNEIVNKYRENPTELLVSGGAAMAVCEICEERVLNFNTKNLLLLFR